MDTEYEKSRIERLKRGLYKADGESSGAHDISRLSKVKTSVQDNWGDIDVSAHTRAPKVVRNTARLLKTFVLLAMLAAVSSGSYLLYQFFDPLDKPSDKNILITLDVPVAVTPGAPVDIVIHVANQNRVNLEYANLSILFPLGTRMSGNTDSDLRDQKKILGMIAPGESAEFRTKAIFLGEENEEKNIRALVEYRFEGMNSTFTKESARPVRMLSSPVSLTVKVVKEVSAGQEVDLSVGTVSNTNIPLRDMFVKIEYPLGFKFIKSDPKPTFGNNTWRIGTLNPSGKYPITISGIIGGSDTEKRVFQTFVGVGENKTEREIGTVYAKAVNEVSVARPFIGIKLAINGKPAGDALARYGQTIDGVVDWQNNLPTRISNAQLEVHIGGVALDRSTVSPGSGGYFRSIDNTLFWDERAIPDLELIESGEKGSINFSFQPFPSISGNQLMVNPTITADVTVRGKRMSDANVPEEIKTVMSQTVRIASEVQLAARSLHYSGVFANFGPMPPRVEKETSYTIVWSIVNTSNSITGARVRGVIPPGVRWYGSVYPTKENVTYNKTSNEIVWTPGDIPFGTGIGEIPPREVAFQVVLFPSLIEAGSEPTLVYGQSFSAIDSFTNSEFTSIEKDVKTDLPTDPSAGRDIGRVAP
jgi:hypothetical protein